MDIPKELLDRVRKEVNYCIDVMDTSGMSDESGYSRVLWQKEWDSIRLSLLWSLDRIDEIELLKAG
jgi:hypothetical protein